MTPAGRPVLRRPVGREGKAPVLQKLIGVIVTVLVLVWVISNPASAGDSVHDWIAGLITFFEHLS